MKSVQQKALIISSIHAVTGTSEIRFEEKGVNELNSYLADGWSVISTTTLGV